MGAALALVPLLKGWPPGQALGRQCARVRRRVLVPEEVDAVGAHLANVLARARVGRLALPPAPKPREGWPLAHPQLAHSLDAA